MRITFKRLLPGLVVALGGTTGIAQAENYLTPVSMSGSTSASSYYASSYEDEQAAQAAPSVGSCTACESCMSDSCCECIGNWRDNTQVWFGADAYKSLGDTIVPPGPLTSWMDSAGVVGGFNTGFRLGQSRVRGQIGASYGVYDLKGRDTVSTSSSEQQTFITAGLYKRSDVSADERISWGGVFDQFFGHQWGYLAGEVYLTQFRGIVGYALSESNEVGFWGTIHANNDGSVTGFLNPIRAMNQANVYWRHNYDFGGQTMAYVGGVDSADVGSWLVGVLGQAPLSDTISLYSNVTFAFPGSKTGPVGANELEWNLGLGLMYSFGGKAVSPTVSGQKGLPLLPVANNGSLLITN